MGDILLQAEIRALGGKTGIYLFHHRCHICAFYAGGIVDCEKDRERQGESSQHVSIQHCSEASFILLS